MPTFEYTARNAQNQLLKGTIDAKDKDDAAKQIRGKKLILVSLNPPPKQIKISFGGSGVPTRDVVIFTRQFSTMINAGLPLVQSLTVLAEQTENKVLGDTTKAAVYDVEFFPRRSSTMITAGLPLVQSLTVLAEQTENKVLGDTTKAVVYDVESGA